MQTRCVRIRLKPGSLERVREWAAEIDARRAEALQTLEDEGLTLECFFLETTEEGDFLIGFTCADNFEQAQATVERSLHAIDAYHQEFKRDTWESGRRLELLVELSRIRAP
ncbi:DUF6176 family protein [Deinococcus sp.]|uniref:DUF6176 family protein n=1 Tax=Deinococcus sp. TaxID=47478 RepID=UPI0025DE3BC0|nr:DUF6176 family protein [Deinococcus sp.]